jgi:hypothetical protein
LIHNGSREKGDAVNDTTTDLDQTDEDILTCAVSDEALEAAAGEERPAKNSGYGMTIAGSYCC